MHRLLERLDGAASTIVPLAYLAGMLIGTAAYFSGLVLDAGAAVGIALALAVELHGFLEQRRVRALWSAHSRAIDEDARARLAGELRAHVGILAALVLFQAYNSLQFLGATWRPLPGIVPEPLQLVIRALVLPACFLVSGALSPLTVEASDELRHASRAMLHRTLRATLRQWDSRIDRARRAGTDLAPVAVSLMLDAGDTDGARRIELIAHGLAVAERGPALLAAPEASPDAPSEPTRPPTGPGSPSAAAPGAEAASVRTVRPATIHALPSPKRATPAAKRRQTLQARAVRTGEAGNASYEPAARLAWAQGAHTIGKMKAATGMSHNAAQAWVRTLKAERSQGAAAL